MTLSTEIVVAIVVASFAAVTSAGAFFYGWINVGPLRAIIEELKSDIKERKAREAAFEKRNTRYLKRIAYLTEGIRVLMDQIRRYKGTPCWTPEDWEPEEPEEPEKTGEK